MSLKAASGRNAVMTMCALALALSAGCTEGLGRSEPEGPDQPAPEAGSDAYWGRADIDGDEIGLLLLLNQDQASGAVYVAPGFLAVCNPELSAEAVAWETEADALGTRYAFTGRREGMGIEGALQLTTPSGLVIGGSMVWRRLRLDDDGGGLTGTVWSNLRESSRTGDAVGIELIITPTEDGSTVGMIQVAEGALGFPSPVSVGAEYTDSVPFSAYDEEGWMLRRADSEMVALTVPWATVADTLVFRGRVLDGLASAADRCRAEGS